MAFLIPGMLGRNKEDLTKEMAKHDRAAGCRHTLQHYAFRCVSYNSLSFLPYSSTRTPNTTCQSEIVNILYSLASPAYSLLISCFFCSLSINSQPSPLCSDHARQDSLRIEALRDRRAAILPSVATTADRKFYQRNQGVIDLTGADISKTPGPGTVLASLREK